MACGSNDIPRGREPEAPNQDQESRKKKEVRENAEMEKKNERVEHEDDQCREWKVVSERGIWV